MVGAEFVSRTKRLELREGGGRRGVELEVGGAGGGDDGGGGDGEGEDVGGVDVVVRVGC